MSLFNKKKEVYKIVEPPVTPSEKVIEEVAYESNTEDPQSREDIEIPKKVEAKIEPEEEEEKVLQVPVFLTPADINRLIYENNIMLKRLMSVIQKE